MPSQSPSANRAKTCFRGRSSAGRYLGASVPLLLAVSLAGAGLLSGCSGDDSEKAIPDAKMMPLGLGTLDISSTGQYAVAVYAERGAAFVTDLETEETTKVPIDGTELGRVLVGSDAAFVADQKNSDVVVVDLHRKKTVGRLKVCSTPRGMTLSEDESTLFVACASGELIGVDVATGEATSQFLLEPDLRDVQLLESGFVVSKFRSAELLSVDAEGKITGRFRPPEGGVVGEPGVAWRTLVRGNRVYFLYQYATNAPLGGGPATGRGYYGNGCSTQVVLPTVSVLEKAPRLEDGELGRLPPGGQSLDDDFWIEGTVHLSGLAGAVDMSVSDAGKVVVVAPGNAWAPAPRRSMVVIDRIAPGTRTDRTGCDSLPNEGGNLFSGVSPGTKGTDPDSADQPEPSDEAFVGVAASPQGMIVAQLAERAELATGVGTGRKRLALGGGNATNVGHRLFHMSTDLAVACVSCHPDGSDDGHVWNFAVFGKRRSQTLRGGMRERNVFHWDGSLRGFDALVREVFGTRMGLTVLPDADQQEKLLTYLDELPEPPSAVADSEEMARRGAALFVDEKVGCSECHTGARFTDGQIYDVGTGGELLTPSLLGLGTRAPYMHDGCAEDLHARFGACGGGDDHGVTSHLSDQEIDALVAFLKTL